jgi:hypothetical protein
MLSTCTPKPTPALILSEPRGADANPPTRSRASPILARMFTQRSLSSMPPSVGTTSRVVRCNRRVPSSASSRATLRLTLDLGAPSDRDAAEKLRSVATLSKTRRSLRSMTETLSHHWNNASTQSIEGALAPGALRT